MLRNLVDTLHVEVQSGSGGDGVVSFKKIKAKSRGIPDGGNGGKGGVVCFQGNPARNDLSHIRDPLLRAGNGKAGQKSNKTGENGETLSISVPIGTRVIDRQSGHLLFEINTATKFLLAEGGKPGLGNAGSHRQSATQGGVGTRLAITLDYRLTADIGIIGLPNSGKSTLLSRISSAKPTIAAYPLTTKTPQLGVCDLAAELPDFFADPLTVVEIPALTEKIPNAGFRFLKHLFKCKAIIYTIDATGTEIEKQFSALRENLRLCAEALAHRQVIAVVTKCDLNPDYCYPVRLLTAGSIVRVVPAPVANTDVDFRKHIYRLVQEETG